MTEYASLELLLPRAPSYWFSHNSQPITIPLPN